MPSYALESSASAGRRDGLYQVALARRSAAKSYPLGGILTLGRAGNSPTTRRRPVRQRGQARSS